MAEQEREPSSAGDLGELLFKYRDYTPIPLIVLLLIVCSPSVASATMGTMVVLLGELIRIYSVSFIGGVSRTRSHSTGPQLVTGGAYGVVRNPLYVGNFFIVLGISIYGGVGWFVALTVAAFVFQYYTVVQFEERVLEEKFGEQFSEYKRTVPAWIPRRIPSVEDWVWPTGLSAALKSEKRTLTAIFLILALLVWRS